MNIKTTFAAVVAVVLAACPAWAQAPAARPVPELTRDREPESVVMPGTVTLSRWLTPIPCLCDSNGESPPIVGEAYFRAGASSPINSWFNERDALGRDMRPGFVV